MIATKNREIAAKDGRIQQLRNEVEVRGNLIFHCNVSSKFKAKGMVIARKNREIATKDGRIQQLIHEVEVRLYLNSMQTYIGHQFGRG